MPKYISPLDDAYIRFDAAAEILAKTNGMATSDSMLEMLTIAMWAGAFNPPDPYVESKFDQSKRQESENWLHIPIQQPRVLLEDGQQALKPLPFEYYEAGRETIISVMYCSDLLPGDPKGWIDMLEGGDGLGYLHDIDNAFGALIQMPLRCYSESGKAYLQSIYIPRRLLQGWLDYRSLDFHDLFATSDAPVRAKPSSPANDAEAQLAATRRGRPRMPAWEFIEIWAVKLKAENPDMSHKELSGILYERAAEDFDEKDMPTEATILRKLSSILDGPPPPMHGNA
tara:strand:+ start:2046 stop:2897 length:852 start_codon:yes stop_codon:yes gene_type:complete